MLQKLKRLAGNTPKNPFLKTGLQDSFCSKRTANLSINSQDLLKENQKLALKLFTKSNIVNTFRNYQNNCAKRVGAEYSL